MFRLTQRVHGRSCIGEATISSGAKQDAERTYKITGHMLEEVD
jgi:hypothetical protein